MGKAMDQAMERAHRVMARCERLAQISEEPGKLTRRYGTPALREARDEVEGWLREAGLATRTDAVGNLFGRREGGPPGTPALMLGSHIDSVRDAGKYDGPLGVLTALACVEGLAAQPDAAPPLPIEVAAFADEEGLRFPTVFLGSSAVAGSFDPAWLEATDRDGTTLAAAMRAIGGDPASIAAARRLPSDLRGYVEVHIEQGPTLESLALPVGVVTAIVGLSRVAVTLSGEAGHAGTLPMARRRDALCAAAETILAFESVARAEPGLVATVGQIAAEPGASNVVPGAVRLSLDLRHADDATRQAALAEARRRADTVAAARGVGLTWDLLYDHPASPADPALSAALAAAVAATGHPVHHLPSGAGHDPAALAAITPTAMLFVRCAGGISHNPAEAVTVEDVAVAIAVLDQFVAGLARGAA